MSHVEFARAESFKRGTHLLRAGLCEEALVEFRAVYREAEAIGDADLMALALCEMGWASFRQGDPEKGLECAMGARRLWQRLDKPGETARALAVESILFLDLGFNDEAFELAGQALGVANASGDPAILSFALNARGLALVIAREAELGAGLLERAVAMAAELGNDAAEAYYLLNLGFAHTKLAEEAEKLGQPEIAMGEREAAIELSQLAIDRAEAAGDYWTVRVALANTAEMLGLQGRYDLAFGLLDRHARLPGHPGTSLRIHYLYTLGDVLMRAGRLVEARAAAHEALTLAEHSGQVDHQVNATARLAEILEAMGEARQALDLQKRFHNLYVLQSGESARRLARIEEIRAETERLRARSTVLAEQALSDPLTGIANRRSFDQILNRLAGSHCSIAIVDLDHFKAVNDRYSHIVGDAVLQRVAATLVGQLGPHGHAARLGGEEFALVFPGAPEAVASAFCEGIRTAIASIDWSDIAPGLTVTVSMGLAEGEGDQPSGELLQLADRRLYAAKSNGRDCIVTSDKPLPVPARATTERRQWRA